MPLVLGPFQAGSDPLGDPRPLKLSDGRQNVHLELSGWVCGVDALVQADKRHAEDRQFIEQGDEVLEVASEAVESPADEDIDPASSRILDESIEGRTPIFRSADRVGVLDDTPPARLGIAPEFVPPLGDASWWRTTS